MNNYVVHPEFLSGLHNYFPDTCTIQEYTQTGTNNVGEPQYDWSNKHTDISCAIGKDTTQEVKQEDKTVRRSTHRIVLQGLYTVDKTMRVESNSQYFDILLPQKDSQSVMTTLVCERVQL